MGKRKAHTKAAAAAALPVPAEKKTATRRAAVAPIAAAELAGVICPTCEREVLPVDRVDNNCPFCGFSLV